MITDKLIQHLHVCIRDFADETNALLTDFTEDKRWATWSVKYNIIKLEFVLTKKEKIVCPKHTLFCRVYLGKNEIYFYHLPEMMPYLDAKNFQCYYYPYIESVERLSACFNELAEFLCRNYAKINELAKSTADSEKIYADKLTEMLALYLSEVPDPQLEADMWALYEEYVLLIHYVGDGPYRQLLLGDEVAAMKQYQQMEKKDSLTAYEKRLVEFLQTAEEKYEILPEVCNSLKNVKQWDNPSKEGKAVFLMGLGCELIFGVIFSVIIVVINSVLANGTVYYAGTPWWCGFIFAGNPAVFGGIAHRNLVRRFLEKDRFEEGLRLEKMINPRWIEPFARVIFIIAFVGCLLTNVQVAFCSTAFYDKYLSFDVDEAFFGWDFRICEYDKVQKVYYSDGVYNDYGDYIDRPSYLIEFEDGVVWDSDGYMDLEDVEMYVLPILKEYYDEIEHIKARNDLIK